MSDGVVRRFLRNSATMAVLYLGANGLGFLVGVLLARLLGAAQYGIYALAMTTSTLAGLVTEFGLPVLVLRETGRARANGEWGGLKGLLGWADRVVIGLSLLIGLAFCGWYWLAGLRLGSAYLDTLLWGVALIPLVALGKLRSYVLLALDAVWAGQAPVMLLRPAVFVLGCLALWRWHGGLDPAGAMAVQALGAGLAMLVMIALYRRHRPAALIAAVPKCTPRDWLATCVPMGVTEGLRLLQGQLALLLVGWLAGAAPAGTYRVADAVTGLTMMISSIIGTAATPLFARLHGAGDRAGLQRIATLAAWAMVGGTVLLGLPVAVGGRWLFPLLFGKDFSPSLPLFLILWSGAMAAACGGMAFALANMVGLHVITTRSFALVAACNLALGLALIPAFGAAGGAAASALSLVIGSAYCAAQVRREAALNTTIFSRQPLWRRATGGQ